MPLLLRELHRQQIHPVREPGISALPQKQPGYAGTSPAGGVCKRGVTGEVTGVNVSAVFDKLYDDRQVLVACARDEGGVAGRIGGVNLRTGPKQLAHDRQAAPPGRRQHQ